VKTQRINKMSHIQISCVLNNLYCKLKNVVAGYSIHQIKVAFAYVGNSMHCIHIVACRRITSAFNEYFVFVEFHVVLLLVNIDSILFALT